MSQAVTIMKLTDREYAVEVHEGIETTDHKVSIPEDLVDEFALSEEQLPQFTEQAVLFLLESRPVTSLPHDLDLSDVRREFPDFVPELQARLRR